MRTIKSMRNSLIRLTGYPVILVLAMGARGVLARRLGSSFLGMESIAINLAFFLALFSLWLQTAAIKRWHTKQQSTSHLQRTMQLTGLLILFLGAVLGILLAHFFAEHSFWGFLFLFYVAEILCTYLWVGKRLSLIAHGREDVPVIYHVWFQSLGYLAEMIILFLFRSLLFGLVAKLACSLLEYVFILWHGERLFNGQGIPQGTVLLDSLEASLKRIGWPLILLSFGCLFIGNQVNIAAAGIYMSDLLMLSLGIFVIGTLSAWIKEQFGALLLCYTHRQKAVQTMYAWLAAFSMVLVLSVIFWLWIDPLVAFWTGTSQQLPQLTRLLLILLFYLVGMQAGLSDLYSAKILLVQWLFAWLGYAVFVPLWGMNGALFSALLVQIAVILGKSWRQGRRVFLQNTGLLLLFGGILIGLCLCSAYLTSLVSIPGGLGWLLRVLVGLGVPLLFILAILLGTKGGRLLRSAWTKRGQSWNG